MKRGTREKEVGSKVQRPLLDGASQVHSRLKRGTREKGVGSKVQRLLLDGASQVHLPKSGASGVGGVGGVRGVRRSGHIVDRVEHSRPEIAIR